MRTKAVFRMATAFVLLAAGLVLRGSMGLSDRGPTHGDPSDDLVFVGLLTTILGATAAAFSNGPAYLLMRGHRLGEIVLSPGRRRAATATALGLVAAAGAAVVGVLTASPTAFGVLFLSLALIGPLTAACKAPPGRVRIVLIGYAGLLAAGGLACLTFFCTSAGPTRDAGVGVFLLCLLIVTAASIPAARLAAFLEKELAKQPG